MSLWQFGEAIDGYVASKTGNEGLSKTEEDELAAMLSAPI